MKNTMKAIGILSMVVLMTVAAFAQPQGQMNNRKRFNRPQKEMESRGQRAMRFRSLMGILGILKARKADYNKKENIDFL